MLVELWRVAERERVQLEHRQEKRAVADSKRGQAIGDARDAGESRLVQMHTAQSWLGRSEDE